MRVTKRNGSTEPVDLNKIVRAVNRSCIGLPEVDAMRVATKTISGLYDGATTSELDRLSIQTAASLITEEPQYGRLAARLLAAYIAKEVGNQDIHAFSASIANGHRLGLVNARLATMVATNARKLNSRSRPSAIASSSTSACARSTTATCCATRRRASSSRRRSSSSCASRAR